MFFLAIDCSAIDKSTVSPSSEGPTTEPAVSTEIATTSSPSNDTTTVAPSNDTTSEAPTTEPSKQTTQPAEPTTTPASTTAIPTPAPGSPDDNRYMAKDVNGSTCILLDAGIEFVVPYVATSGVSKNIYFFFIRALPGKVISLPVCPYIIIHVLCLLV